MYLNDPLPLAVMLADRRADLQRAGSRWRAVPAKTRRRRLRRPAAFWASSGQSSTPTVTISSKS